MVTRDDSNVSRNTFRKQLDEDTDVHEIGKAGLMFGISFINDNNEEILNNSEYLTYTVKQVSQVYVDQGNGTRTINRTKTNINMSQCGDSYSRVPQETVQRLNADQFYCPTSNDFTVAANFYAPRFDYIEMKFYK